MPSRSRARLAAFRAAVTLCALLALPATAEPPPGGTWLRYPLPGAEVKSLVADPAVKNSFYLGTAQGGIYRSTDSGRSWSSPPGGAPFPGFSVTSLAVDPVKRGTIWAGLTGVLRGGLLVRSDDSGRSWYEVRSWETRAASRVVAISVLGGRRVVAVGGDYGVELTEDDGVSWRVSLPPLDPGSGVSFLSFHPARPSVLYCGSFRHPFRSTDLGRTWTRIANGMIEDTEVFVLDFAPESPDDFWAATCGWVYRTTDGGSSWTRFKEGLSDRRTHVVRRDPRIPARVLAGTTGGLFESVSSGKSFRRIGRETVVNALVFDPNDPSVLLIGTETEGVLRSEDGGLSVSESNRGLAEARISAVTETKAGRVVMARAADGPSGGLWALEPESGEAKKLLTAPPATVLALTAMGERLLAGTPDGLFAAEAPGAAFVPVLGRATRGFASDGRRLLAATDAGVYESRDGGLSWFVTGSLRGRVESIWRARFNGAASAPPTFAVDSGGHTLWWDGKDWVLQGVRLAAGAPLTGGFGRPQVHMRWKPDPIGLEVDLARSLLVFRPEDQSEGLALRLPENGLSVAGWSGDPRSPRGLYLATLGRGLFRYVPAMVPLETVPVRAENAPPPGVPARAPAVTARALPGS